MPDSNVYSQIYVAMLDKWSSPGVDLVPRIADIRTKVGDDKFFAHTWTIYPWATFKPCETEELVDAE